MLGIDLTKIIEIKSVSGDKLSDMFDGEYSSNGYTVTHEGKTVCEHKQYLRVDEVHHIKPSYGDIWIYKSKEEVVEVIVPPIVEIPKVAVRRRKAKEVSE